MQGVLLSHRAVMAAAVAQALLIDHYNIGGLGPGDAYLSYLPLAHIFDRCAPPAGRAPASTGAPEACASCTARHPAEVGRRSLLSRGPALTALKPPEPEPCWP